MIGEVGRMTGLSPDVIRAWESRYRTVTPTRSPGGTRLYSDADVLRLRLLARATAAGRPIRSVARLSTEELLALTLPVAGAPEATGVPDSGRSVAREALTAALLAVEQMDGPALHAALMGAIPLLRPGEFVDQLMYPLLTRAGELWGDGTICAAHEHLLSVQVRRVLGWLLDTLPAPPEAPLLITTTLAGQRHEFGAMLAGFLAAEAGWRVVHLGADLPAADIGRAARQLRAVAVALSVVMPMPPAELSAELIALHAALPGRVEILVGCGDAEMGEAARAAGATHLPEVGSIRSVLRELSNPRAGDGFPGPGEVG